jgi:hypothetical protein
VRKISRESSIPNPLIGRDAPLVEALSAFRSRVHDQLLDKLAAGLLKASAFRAAQSSNTIEELQATALILRVLTKDTWDQEDMHYSTRAGVKHRGQWRSGTNSSRSDFALHGPLTWRARR